MAEGDFTPIVSLEKNKRAKKQNEIDEDEKKKIASVVKKITDHILENNFHLCDVDGVPTTWANWEPELLNNDDRWFYERGTNSLEILSFLKTTREKFDIVFIDPPYKKQLAEKALSLVLNVLNDGGIIVCETDIKEELPEAVGNYTVAKQDTYSKTKLTIYRYNGDDE